MNDLKERLARIADDPGPAPAVDVAAAVARGRRIRRTRRGTSVAVAAGVAVAVAGVAVLPSSSDERPGRVAAPSEDVGYPSPLIEKAAFGWLPAGYARTGAGQDDQQRPVFSLSAGRGRKSRSIELNVFGPGPQPGVARLPGGRKGHLTKAAPVHGRPAYWSIKPGGPGSEQVAAEFRWEYQPKSWALLTVTDRGIADAATVQRIAAGVRFGGQEPMAFPLRVTGVPAGLSFTRVLLSTRPDAQISLAAPGGAGDLMISISLSSTRQGFKPNTTIDGHPALDTRLPHEGGRKTVELPASETTGLKPQNLWVMGVRGFDINIHASGEPLRRLQATGGLTGLFRRITPLGTDPARWTTTPLR